jgi:hypothetical protein
MNLIFVCEIDIHPIPTVEALNCDDARAANGKDSEYPQAATAKLSMPLIQHHAGAYSLRGAVSLTAKPAMIDLLAWHVDIPANSMNVMMQELQL